MCVRILQTQSVPCRSLQNQQAAWVFYAFLAQVYDYIVNPPHWDVTMRAEALQPAQLTNADLGVVDVGGGTGFCTLGIVQTVDPRNVTLLDQSPHQLSKAKKKKDLEGVTIVEGDSMALPFATDSFDRYVSAGSIEYWDDPQRAFCEAYRVLKPGGIACMIGPVRPTNPVSKFFADAWMLFPEEREYVEWYEKAGFKDIKMKRIGPSYYRGVRRHGLIMGCSVTATKPGEGPSPLELPPRQVSRSSSNPLAFLARVLLGTIAGFYYFLLPIYMYLKNLIWPRTGKWAEHF